MAILVLCFGLGALAFPQFFGSLWKPAESGSVDDRSSLNSRMIQKAPGSASARMVEKAGEWDMEAAIREALRTKWIIQQSPAGIEPLNFRHIAASLAIENRGLLGRRIGDHSQRCVPWPGSYWVRLVILRSRQKPDGHSPGNTFMRIHQQLSTGSGAQISRTRFESPNLGDQKVQRMWERQLDQSVLKAPGAHRPIAAGPKGPGRCLFQTDLRFGLRELQFLDQLREIPICEKVDVVDAW